MWKKRDDIEWGPAARAIPWISDTGEIVTPERTPFWKWIKSFFHP